MKKITAYFLIIAFLTSCVSTTKMVNRGQYDAAIGQACRKLARKKTLDKEMIALETAYKKANDRDKERVDFLKKEGNANGWDGIYQTYAAMKQRQDMVKPLLPLHIASKGREAQFAMVNYDDEIIAAKQKAAEYLYNHAMTLLNKGDIQSARSAYNELKEVKNIYSDYKDVDQMITKASVMGTSYVIFKMENKTGVPLPPNFESDLTKLSLQELDHDWVKYHVVQDPQINYAYTILVNMKQIDVTPEYVKDIEHLDTKEIQDGWQYLLDAKGNVKKDTAGNDLKLPKMKTISCKVTERYQNKKAIIAGTLDYIDNRTGQIIKTDPITAENFFEHRSGGNAIGDLNALKPEHAALVGKQPVPFPTNFAMLLTAGQTLKGMVKTIIWSNKSLLN